LEGSEERWRASARQFAEAVIEPRAELIDANDRLPEGFLDAVRASGFMGLGVAPQWGGQGGGTGDVAAVLEELSAASAAVATLLAVHLSVAAAPIATWGTDPQKEQYLRPLAQGRYLGAFGLTESDAGSDAAALRTRYERTSDGFVITGSKMFITNAASADVVLIFATRDPSMGRKGISAFLLPRGAAGFTIAQHLTKLGLRGSETTELALDHVRLPESALLGPEGEGLRVALSALGGGRVGIAACALGVARAAFDEMVRATRADPADWKRAVVARAYVDLAAARALLDRAVAEREAGRPGIEAASTAKLYASQAALRIAHRGFELAGSEAMRSASRAGRYLRDARVFPIVEGTTEIQELILGRTLLGRE
jgi:alkylation response protein AidB-like acyl-CoA dehydrogenase